MSRKPKYGRRIVPPLSDGRTPGVCSHCGQQHPQVTDIELIGRGCYDPASVFVPARGAVREQE